MCTTMKVLVTGSRDKGVNKQYVWTTLDKYPITCLIAGGASGVDEYASEWADASVVPCMTFFAPWKGMKARGKLKAAGPIRNGWMLEHGKPDLVLAFPGGSGTRNMVMQAEKAGITVKRITTE